MLELRLENCGVGLSRPDERDPISGHRVLLLVDQDTGTRVVVPVDDAVVAHLHEQTSAIIVAGGDVLNGHHAAT